MKSFYHLPLSSFQWLLTGLFLAAIPLWFQLPAAMIFGFLGCLVWRFVLERKGMKCPSPWMRCGVSLMGLLLILVLHGTLLGLTAGIGVLLLLMALKVLEMRTEREFMLLCYLSFFILLTSLFFSQTLLACLYEGLVFLILTATVVQFTGGASEGFRTASLLRHTTLLLLQALPLILLFFIFLPRMKGGGLLHPPKSNTSQSGMSEQINPGSFAELALNEEPVFRADFPEGVMPPYNNLYWRVAVFTECHGLNWRTDQHEREALTLPKLTGPLVVQRISMEPHEGRWVYALDRPLVASGPVTMRSGHFLSMNLPSPERLNIRVTSQLGNDRTPLSEEARRLLTEVPDNLTGRCRQLVDSWLQKTREPRELVKLAQALFRKENFRYTLTPGTYSSNGLDEFLFERKLGFCEHYAAAFATLMRMAGLPSRIVAGYHGGERNPFSDYLIIRQSDAHAWVEVWINGDGWVRFDPVDFINPLRVDPDTPLASRFPSQLFNEDDSQTSRDGGGFFHSVTRVVRLGWDTVNFQWNLHIVSYDQASQRDFYQMLGIRSLLSGRLIGILLAGMLAVLGPVYLLLRQKPVKKDRLLLLYRQFCRLLAQHGVVRPLNEGPLDFARRAVGHFPEQSDNLMELFDGFTAMRYGDRKSKVSEREILGRLHSLKIKLRKKIKPLN